jgi:transcriptional regulator with XRE-family HTH domain
MSELAAVLRQFRERAAFSQNKLALYSRINPAYVHRLENGAQSRPAREVLVRLAVTLELAPSERDELLCAAGYCPESLLALSPRRRRRVLVKLAEVSPSPRETG